MEKIYVKLLEEGTTVFRPVLARKIGDGTFQLIEVVPPVFEDEELEFAVGTKVVVEYKQTDANTISIVAVQEVS